MSRRIGEGSEMRISTSRIGLISVHASAPVVDGTLTETTLSLRVRIDEVSTGNPLLDPELHALIRALTQGTLQYSGERSGDVYSGTARAGDITVPLELTTSPDGTTVQVSGRSTFQDLHVPLPGMGHIRHLEVDIDGRLHLEG